MRDLLPFLRLYKQHWFGLTLGMLLAIATLISAMGLLTLSGWFIAAAAVAGLASISTFNYMVPAAGVRGFSISRTAGRWGERVVSHNATFKLLADLRIYFFRQLTPLIPGKVGSIRDADMLNRLVSDVDAMDHVYLRLISPLIVSTLGIVAISGFLMWFDIEVGLTLGLILFGLMLTLPIVFYRLGRPHGAAITSRKSAFRVSLLDWLQGHSELVIFGAQDRYRKQVEDHESHLLAAQKRMAFITGLANATLMAANGLTLVIIIWLAADGVGQNQPDPLIAMVAFAAMASFELMMPVAGAFQYLSQTLTSAKRLNEVIGAEPDTVFSASGYNTTASGNIELSNVSYRYPESNHNAVSSVSLTIEAGEKVAILGRTGCGKSTLLQLLTRSWDPTEGGIQLDGIDLPQWRETNLRQSISVVSQRVDVFNGSLRSNLVLAKEDATDSELISVLESVGLEKLLSDPGLDTWLGDGGRQLSGGERRRLGIARALLHDAPILLLDEPTEGLDIQTEQQILSLLMEFAQNKTVIFITHRLIGLEQMDKICLMDQGDIIEQGNHATLIAQGGRYSDLLNRL